MECIKCKKAADIRVQNIIVCASCLEKIIIKRVRKETRESKLFRRDDSILIIDDGTKEAKLTISIMKRLLGDMPLSITVKKKSYTLGEKIAGKENKVIVPWNADMEGSYFLDSIFLGKNPKYLGNFTLGRKRYIKLLMPVLSLEIEKIVKSKGWKFRKEKTGSFGQMMTGRLEAEYPEIKFSLLKSAKELSR